MAKIDFEQLRFVIVDDNAHMRRILRTMLRAFGSREIYEAEEGASGLEAVEAYQPDILITDLKMPIFDGIELTRMIRNPDGFSQAYLPIIMLSAYSEKHQVISARDAGANDFICKPVSATTLYARIESIIEHPRPFIRTASYFGPDRRRQENVFSGDEKRVVDSDQFVQIPD
ncbi:MAG: response regulator [Hyphomicrobiaceae bacterium]|nr:response regulator [Hyphomicrobiaceae bacterium]